MVDFGKGHRKMKRAAWRIVLRNRGYWMNLCREKNGKPLYRWHHVMPNYERVRKGLPRRVSIWAI